TGQRGLAIAADVACALIVPLGLLGPLGPLGTASAATLQWDPDQATSGPQGGSGTWQDAAPGWWNGAGNVNWTGTDNGAEFGVTGGTVNVNGGVSASSLTFDTNGYLVRPDPM